MFISRNNSVATWNQNQLPTVRCSTKEKAEKMHCELEENCKCDASETTMHCTCKDINMMEIFRNIDHVLPKTTPVWQLRSKPNTEIIAISNWATSCEIAISIDEIDEAVMVRDIDECSINHINTTGCYNCDTNVETLIECKSNEQQIIGDIDCESEKFAVQCSPEGTKSTIKFFATRANFQRKCQISCGSTKNKFEINTNLDFHGSFLEEAWKVISGKTKYYDSSILPDIQHIYIYIY
ncbi:unnamed protein product [Caenorhabditis angaria]|uniref:Phlebovirus glycoprotein G2 fusion domain-containing protein n=1 Tax=Caenorhabditis angaria TaxID=860376 RepID=A0A9P1I8N8_9PELO|nr:unnamed protein product [Caenorhabditis angaria]